MKEKLPEAKASKKQTSSSRLPKQSGELAGELVGVMVSRFDCAYYASMLDSLCEVLIRNGYNPLVHPTYASPQGERQLLELFIKRQVKGIIYRGDFLTNTELQELLVKHPQIIVMARKVPDFEERCVYVDNDQGARQAARHLMEKGHTNIAMITGPQHKLRDVSLRTHSFTSELIAHGLSIPAELIVQGDFSVDSGLAGIHSLLSSNLPFTAVFAQNDDMAVGVRAGCKEYGLRVPEDISIIGFDDLIHLTQVGSPKLSSIRQPRDKIGRRAAQALHEMISGGFAQNPLSKNYGRIEPELIERDSVAFLQRPQRKPKDLKGPLTTREAECLKLIANGKTSGQIAIILSISQNTVNFHLKNTMYKLDACNRVHALAKAIKHELITL